MSSSATATLFFGYDLGENEPEVEIDEIVSEATKAEHDAIDWHSRPLWAYNGRQHAYDEYVAQYDERKRLWDEANSEAFKIWRDARSRVEKELGVTIGWHGCLNSYSQSYIAVLGTETKADWGDSVEVMDLSSQPLEDYAEILHNFMNKYEIEIPEGGPKWLLVADYG